MKEMTVKIIDRLGIHARPATVLVGEASKFECECKAIFNGKEGNLKSVMGVMALGIKCDDDILLKFEGVDEDAAFEAIVNVMKQEGLI